MKGIEDVKDPKKVAMELCRQLHKEWADTLSAEAVNPDGFEGVFVELKEHIMVMTHALEEYLKSLED